MITIRELTQAMLTLSEEGPLKPGMTPVAWFESQGIEPHAGKALGHTLTDVAMEYIVADYPGIEKEPLRQHIWETMMTAFETGWVAHRDHAHKAPSANGL